MMRLEFLFSQIWPDAEEVDPPQRFAGGVEGYG